MDKLQRSFWLLSTPVNAEQNWAKPEFTKVKYQKSRIQKDHKNAQKMFEFLVERDQFYIDTVLINLDGGKLADGSVNAFQAQTIRESLIQGIAGTSGFDYKFRKKDMVIIIKNNTSVSIEDCLVEGDPRLPFQRLIVFIQPSIGSARTLWV